MSSSLRLLACIFFIFFITNTNAIEIKNPLVVVFDFGGVIADANTNKMANFLMDSFALNKDELSQAFEELQNYYGTEEQFWKQLAQSKKIVLADDWIEHFEVIIHHSITKNFDTFEIVKALKAQGYQTAILSDMTQYQSEVIKKMGYFNLFDPVILSFENRVCKPNPKAFQILLIKLNQPASSVIFIDDRLGNVNAAKALGIDAIHFIHAKQLRKELEKRGFILDIPT